MVSRCVHDQQVITMCNPTNTLERSCYEFSDNTFVLVRCDVLAFGTPTVVIAAGTVILIDGQNNHDWKSTTPILVQALTRDGRFDVAVATSPPRGGDMNTFRPKFSEYDAVLSNYNGDLWSEETCRALENFVSMGGALVVVHAANNSFPEWKEWNTLIGLGGWGGRNEKSGPLVRWKDGKMVQDNSPGAGGHHGSMHPFAVVVRDQTHPIVEGLPTTWMHANDELYDRLRGLPKICRCSPRPTVTLLPEEAESTNR